MNICVVNPGFQMGGAERIVIEFANLLSTHHNVNLVDFYGKNSYYYNVSSSIEYNYKITELKRAKKILWALKKIQFKLTGNCYDLTSIYKEQLNDLIRIIKLKKIDIVIMCQGLLTSLIPYLKKNIPSIKIIAWQHNNYETYTQLYYKSIAKYYLQGIEESDLVICLTKNDETKYKKVNNNSKCIYNFLTIDNPIISTVLNQNIIFVGRLVIKHKGLDFLLNIGKNLPSGWKILIAGTGKDEYKFKQMIESEGIKDKIKFYGNLDDKGLRNLYSSGSIFISTSRWEGFGLVITEAMASGLPVISFNNLGPEEILLHGKYGVLIDKFNMKQFNTSILKMIENYEERKYWSMKSLRRSLDFKKEKIILKWDNEFKKLIL